MRSKKRYVLNQSPFYKLQTKRKLAAILNINLQELDYFSKNSHSLYVEWDEVNENTGKTRRIQNPKQELKKIQKRIASILSRITPPNFLFCPVKGRSYIDNAKQHVNQKQVCCIDIKKYFESTTSLKIYYFFHTYLGCSKDVAGILTKISTLDSRLPTGSPLSPILSYFANVKMWENILSITQKHDCILSVYMDDITISGCNVSSFLMWRIRRQIHSHGLRYHKEKRYVGNFSEITGIINKNGKLMLPNRQLRKIYELSETLKELNDGAEKTNVTNKLLGHKGQLNQILIANKT